MTLRKALLHAKLFPGSYNYALSEPILLEWILEDDPTLFKEIQEEVKRGGRIETRRARRAVGPRVVPDGQLGMGT